MQKLKSWLFNPVNSSMLGLYRVLFGACLIYESVYYYKIGLIERGLRQPVLLFPYEGFEWVKMLPGKGLEVVLFLLLISAICITIGWMFRKATIIFLAGFSYFFFLDKGLYNNHLYLFILLLFLFSLTDAYAAFSISKKRHKKMVPAWQLWIFRFQLIIVYLYGGFAKLNADWLLNFQPVRLLLEMKPHETNIQLYIIVYGGLIFDILVGFALLWKKTRMPALIAAIIFNTTNAILFNDIGVFPFFMMLSLVIFFDPGLPGKWFPVTVKTKEKKDRETIAQHWWVIPVLSIYMLFQVLFPFRWMLYKGNPDWYGEAQRFSWRMKVQSRTMEVFKLTVLDYSTKHKLDLDPARYLTYAQLLSLRQDPRMLMHFIRFIEADAKKQGITNPVIHADLQVSFNGHPVQHVIDPAKNACAINEKKPLSSWVMALKE